MNPMKPILFNTEMVRANLDGRKTFTRRVANISTEITCSFDDTTNHEFVPDNFTGGAPTGFVCRKCGFGVAPPRSRVPCGESLFRPRYWPGDILYVRETFTEDGGRYYYRADFESDWLEPCETLSGGYPAACRHRNCDACCAEGERIRWHPSIHMPKEAARIFLRVTHVWIERLQAITDEEAIKEGVPDEWPMAEIYCPECRGEGLIGSLHPMSLGYMEIDCPHCEKAVSRFANLWNSTIKPADLATYGWEANPWVWVIEFERISKEEAMK